VTSGVPVIACVYCHREVVDLRGCYQKIQGWEHKALTPSRRGGSDIVLRQQLDEWACAGCIHKLQVGVSVDQGVLIA
jgi:hypothetical protein